MACVVVLICLSPATASLSPRNGASPGKELPRAHRETLFPEYHKAAPADGAKEDFVINDDSEIKLDGRACEYKDVPGDAEITLFEVAADKKTVVKIHFQSKK